METIIRKAAESDLGSVYRFLCELSSEELELETFKTIYLENTSNTMNPYLVSETAGEVSGFISLHTQNLLHHSGLVGEVQEFYVDKVFRGKGIGKLLMNEVKAYAKQNNLKSIEVTSNKRRTENVKVYENLGFRLSHNKFTIYLEKRTPLD